MAGSLAINIYSASRVAEESTRLEPVPQRAAESLNTHAQTPWSAVGPFSHPAQLQHRQTDWTLLVLFLTSQLPLAKKCSFKHSGGVSLEVQLTLCCGDQITAAERFIAFIPHMGWMVIFFFCCGFTEMGGSALLAVVLAAALLSISATQPGERNVPLLHSVVVNTPDTLMNTHGSSQQEKPSHHDSPVIYSQKAIKLCF